MLVSRHFGVSFWPGARIQGVEPVVAEGVELGMPKPVHGDSFHVRFSFDRSPLLRMHTALCEAAKGPHCLLPPSSMESELPSQTALQAALGRAPQPKQARLLETEGHIVLEAETIHGSI